MTTLQHKEHYDVSIRGLAGKPIKRVRHMVDEEIKGMSWYESVEDTIVIEFTDNSYAIVTADPEGNGAGFLFVEDYE